MRKSGKCGVVVGGNAALWLRLDRLSERGGGNPVALSWRVESRGVTLSAWGRSSSSIFIVIRSAVAEPDRCSMPTCL